MSFKQAAIAGIRWSSVAQICQQTVQILTTVILARVLAPGDFGLVGMITVITGFVALFKDLGTASAVIQKKEASEKFLSSIFWLNVAIGCLATIILFVIAPLVANFYQEPRIVALLEVLSISFFFSGISILQKAILERNLAFATLAKIEVLSMVLGSLVGISSALLGAGVWSLIVQILASVVSATILFWIFTNWRPHLAFQWREIKSISNYSLHLTGSSIWFYFVRNSDKFLIGKFLGAEALGYYVLAYRLMMYPLQSIGAIISRVMFPIFSQRQDDNEWFRYAYLNVSGLVAAVVFPIVMGLLVVSEQLILTLFGSHWSPTIPLLLILLPAGLVESIEAPVSLIYQAKGRTDWMFRLGIVTGTIVIFAFILGLRWGVIGVAVAYVCTLPLSFVNVWIAFKLIRLPALELFSVLWRPLFSSLLMLGSLLLLNHWLPTELAGGWTLGIVVLTGSMAYLLVSWLFNRDQLRLVLSSIAGQVPRLL